MSLPTLTAESLPPDLEQALNEAVANALRPQAAISDVLRLLQSHFGWINDACLMLAASLCTLHPVQVEELCSFYPLVLREWPGRHVLRICDSIACHLAGAPTLLAAAEARSAQALGTVHPQGAWSALPHVCLGLCDQAPAVMVDEQVEGDWSLQRLQDCLQRWEDGP